MVGSSEQSYQGTSLLSACVYGQRRSVHSTSIAWSCQGMADSEMVTLVDLLSAEYGEIEVSVHRCTVNHIAQLIHGCFLFGRLDRVQPLPDGLQVQ